MSTVTEKRNSTTAKAIASSSPSKKSKSVAASAAASSDEHDASQVVSHDKFLLKMMKTAASDIMVNPARSISISGVLHCNKDDVLPEILKTLDEQKILSMPVCLRRNNIFIGFIEIQDVVTFISQKFANRRLTTYDQFQKMWDSIDSFNITTVDDIMNYVNKKVAPVHPIPAGYSLFHAFEVMARGVTRLMIIRSGCHRVCVTNDRGQIVTILTQSMMVDYAKVHMKLIADEIRNRHINQLVGLHDGTPIVVKDTDRVIRAFQLMSQHDVSGVGVVNAEGKLVDVVSARDLRGTPLNAVSYYGLYSTVREWKESVRANYPKSAKFVVSVRNEDSLEHLVNEMAVHKVHRVFVIDEEQRPVKCIAQTDVLRNLLVPSGVEA